MCILTKYKCLIVNLVFSHLGFWSANFFLIAPFPDHCLLVPFYRLLHYKLLVFLMKSAVFLRSSSKKSSDIYSGTHHHLNRYYYINCTFLNCDHFFQPRVCMLVICCCIIYSLQNTWAQFSLMMSLSPQFINNITASKANTLLFFTKASHIFST